MERTMTGRIVNPQPNVQGLGLDTPEVKAIRAAFSQYDNRPVSNNLYEPLQGYYASPMYLMIVDDFGNATVGVWPICEIRGSELH